MEWKLIAVLAISGLFWIIRKVAVYNQQQRSGKEEMDKLARMNDRRRARW